MITLGFVGCAHCHTPWIVGELKKRTDLRIKTVFDHIQSRAESIAGSAGCPIARNADEILNDPEITAVFICSETNRHQQDVLAAVKSKKHLFVEKPLGMGAEDSRLMDRAIEKSKLIFMTGYRTRSEGMFMFLRDQIQKGNFGKITRIRYISCHGGTLKGGFQPDHRWMYDPKQAGGGAFLDLGTHALDSLLWLMGEEVTAAASVTGIASKNGKKVSCEEFGEGLIKFKNGAVGSLAAAWVDVVQPVRCTISGTEGHASVINNQLFFKSSRVPGADGKNPWTDLPPDRPLVFNHFVDAAAGTNSDVFITPREAAYVCAVQDALTQGAKLNRWVKPQWRKW